MAFIMNSSLKGVCFEPPYAFLKNNLCLVCKKMENFSLKTSCVIFCHYFPIALLVWRKLCTSSEIFISPLHDCYIYIII